MPTQNPQQPSGGQPLAIGDNTVAPVVVIEGQQKPLLPFLTQEKKEVVGFAIGLPVGQKITGFKLFVQSTKGILRRWPIVTIYYFTIDPLIRVINETFIAYLQGANWVGQKFGIGGAGVEATWAEGAYLKSVVMNLFPFAVGIPLGWFLMHFGKRHKMPAVSAYGFLRLIEPFLQLGTPSDPTTFSVAATNLKSHLQQVFTGSTQGLAGIEDYWYELFIILAMYGSFTAFLIKDPAFKAYRKQRKTTRRELIQLMREARQLDIAVGRLTVPLKTRDRMALMAKLKAAIERERPIEVEPM